MNGQSKFPLATMATALALILGPLSAQADGADSNQQAADMAGSHVADAGKQAKAADQAKPDVDVAAGDDAAEDAAEQDEAKADVAADDDIAEQDETNADVAASDDVGESDQAVATDADDSGGEVAISDTATAEESMARSKSFTKTIATPHMTMSISRSIGMAKDEDGDMAMAKAMAKAKALDTPGTTRTDTMSKTTVRVDGDAMADAAASADASVDASGMSVETFAETSVAVE
jgi:hypothetical protein